MAKRARDGMSPRIAMQSFGFGGWRPTFRDAVPPPHLSPTETELQRGYLRFAVLRAEIFPDRVEDFE
eukprot:3990774-Lingulodinium_polyedra.AAC.1